MGLGSLPMTPKQIEDLLAQGKDVCDYFEHVLMRMGWNTGHSPIGCKWCKEEVC